MLQYIETRREETKQWLQYVSCQTEIHYLNVPDQVNLTDENNAYLSKIFEKINFRTPFEYICEKVSKIVANNIIVVNNYENHPSHKLAYSISQSLLNKKIFYSVHDVLNKTSIKNEGVYYNKIDILEDKYFNYYYVYSEEETLIKQKEFKTFYYSQYKDFLKTKLTIRNWEHYVSEVPLRLTHEDKISKMPGD